MLHLTTLEILAVTAKQRGSRAEDAGTDRHCSCEPTPAAAPSCGSWTCLS